MKAIVCYDKKSRGIGRDGKLLFNIAEDLKYFKGITDGKIVVMGANTYSSMDNKPLPNRINIVITKHPEMYNNSTIDDSDGTMFVTPKTFLSIIKNMKNTDNIICIGGEETYKLLLPFCDQVYATEVQCTKLLNPDTYFPELDNIHWKKSPDTFLCMHDGIEVYTTLYTKKFEKVLWIPRATKVGQYNVNGIIYYTASYNEACEKFINRYKHNEKSCNERFDFSAPCEIFYDANNIYKNWSPERYDIIDPANSYGVRLVYIDDNECELLFTDKEVYEKVKEFNDKNQAHMLMRYIARVSKDTARVTICQVAYIEKIIAFDLSLGEDKAYYAERIDDK